MTAWGVNANEVEESYAKLVEEYFSVESMEALNAQGTSAAHEAVRHDHHEMLEARLKKGVDVNVTEDQPQVAGTTLLMTAQNYDLHASYILTPVFIEKGADVNRADNNGNTVLMLHAE